MRLSIDQTWDGTPIDKGEQASVSFVLEERDLMVQVDAPYAGDPPPHAPVGRADRLWEHEVVELFILGEGERYLEIELGPHGHYLALRLEGVRHVKQSGIVIEYEAVIGRERWTGTARVPRTLLPPAPSRVNAYAIRGYPSRQYYAAFPVPGEIPDFHRLHCFGPWDL